MHPGDNSDSEEVTCDYDLSRLCCFLVLRLEVVELSNEAIPRNEVLFFTHWKSKKRE